MDLTGKNVVYVGGFGGIGQEACKELVKRNVKNLVILDKCSNEDTLNNLKALNPKVQQHYWNYDVTTDVENMKKTFQDITAKIKTIDILINGAGILNDRAIERTIQINLIGCINTTVAAFDHMDKRNGGPGGVIVNIASVAGLNGFPTVPVYSATKAAIINFSTSIAQLEPITGIKVFAVCPGITRTPILHNINTFLGIDDTLSSNISKLSLQTPEECAKNFVDAIEMCKNGAVWLLDNNEKNVVDLPVFWAPPKELL